MKKYLPNKSEIATLVFGFGLGVLMAISLSGSWGLGMLFFWPIFFIAMPLVYVIGKRKNNSDCKLHETSAISTEKTEISTKPKDKKSK